MTHGLLRSVAVELRRAGVSAVLVHRAAGREVAVDAEVARRAAPRSPRVTRRRCTTGRPASLVLSDELECLVVDDRLDHGVEGLLDDLADALLVPPLRERQHRVAHAREPGFVGAEVHVHELAVQRAEQQPPRDQPLAVEGRPNATIDAFAMTVLSRSKNAASTPRP